MRIVILLLSFIVMILSGCSSDKEFKSLTLDQFDTLTFKQTSSIRGVDVFNNKTVWISGNKGFFARSVNAGESWNSGIVNSDSLLDYRDIHAFSESEAIVMSAGSPARFYKTYDGGNTWRLCYENMDEKIFFNSIEFWDNKNGIACGDPIDGWFQILLTIDGGENWNPVAPDNLPTSLDHEGGFAASGTSIALGENGLALYALGGESTRILRSEDFGKSWEAVLPPFISGEGGYGIYSIVHMRGADYAAIGGHWKFNDEAEKNFITSKDSGKTWQYGYSMPNGYRSCIRFGRTLGRLIASGRNGVDVSFDEGNSWELTDLPPFYSFDLSECEELIVFAGADGKVAIKKQK